MRVTVPRREPRSILNSFGAAFNDLENEGPMGRAALQIKAKLGERVKLVEHVDLHRIEDEDEALVFRCKSENRSALIAALKEAGVTQSESFIPGLPGRMWWGQGRDKVEVRVSSWQSAYPA